MLTTIHWSDNVIVQLRRQLLNLLVLEEKCINWWLLFFIFLLLSGCCRRRKVIDPSSNCPSVNVGCFVTFTKREKGGVDYHRSPRLSS